MRHLILLAAALLWLLPAGHAFAEQSNTQRYTNPACYTTIREHPLRGKAVQITTTFGEIGDRSLIEIQFEEEKMASPSPDGNGGRIRQVQIRVEAFQTRNGVQTPIAPIDNYVSRRESKTGKPPKEKVTIEYAFHDKPYDMEPGQQVPDTMLNLSGLRANDADQIEIRVTNLQTQESLIQILKPRAFGFRVSVTDSLLFLKRLCVSQEDGVDTVNFAPAPGVTYGGTYLSRKGGFIRFLQPGVGLSVSFMNWKDPAFDVATGKFVSGTKSSDLNIGLGAQFLPVQQCVAVQLWSQPAG